MNQPSKLVAIFSKPHYQAALVAGMILFFSLVDFMLPHNNDFFEPSAGAWIVATAMILCFIILNAVVALQIEPIIPYWSKSVIFYLALLAFSYAWCYLLTGRHMDEVGSFRWLWFVLTLVYMIFFMIARSMKRIVDLAIRQDKKLRGEE
jgi:thiol:disulfide interchange protein